MLTDTLGIAYRIAVTRMPIIHVFPSRRAEMIVLCFFTSHHVALGKKRPHAMGAYVLNISLKIKIMMDNAYASIHTFCTGERSTPSPPCSFDFVMTAMNLPN